MFSLTTIQKAGIGAGAALVLLFAIWYWVYLGQEHARNLAIAEEQNRAKDVIAAKNKEVQEIRDKAEEQDRIAREATAALVQANLELVGTIRTTQAAREREATVRQSQLLRPKPIDEVVQEARAILGIEPTIQADGSANIAKESLQAYIALKDRVDSLELSRAEDQRQIRLLEDNSQRQQETIESLEVSLAAKDQTIREDKSLIVSQEVVIKSYEKVTKKTGWQKAASVAQKLGEIAITAAIVGVIAK